MKKDHIIWFLCGCSGVNTVVVLICVILKHAEMKHYAVNSDEWFLRYGQMINCVPFFLISHAFLLIASFVNTSGKLEKSEKQTRQLTYEYNQHTKQYELTKDIVI